MATPTFANSEARLQGCLQTGQQHYSAARFDDAIAAFQAGLALAEDELRDNLPAAILADLHARLANAFMAGGQLGSASENYKAALRLVPTLTACWCNLGNVHLKSGRAQDAISLYLQALQLNPGHWPSRTNLVQALLATKQHPVAKTLLLELIEERPNDAGLHHELGKVCYELQEMDNALAHFERAIAVSPQDAESLYWIGGIRQSLDQIEAAQAAYLKAAQIQPLIKRPAARTPAAFRALALYAPFAGNIPTGFLFKDANYDLNTLALLPSGLPEANYPGNDIEVVVNLISDADQSLDILPLATDLVRRLGKPTINHPEKIARTTRDAVAELLQDIPSCRVPRTLRLCTGTDRSTSALESILTFPFPVLARPAGTHGGDDFEKIADIAELASYIAKYPGEDCYLIEYIGYLSADNYFRKYRFIFVGEDIQPYHLVIGDDWKLHHDSSDMGAHAWMQQEELAFLSDPGAAFSPSLLQALRTIKERIGLDYFGIDCGVDASGNLVVFEVNASMLVHDQNEAFPYKDPFVRRIKVAFDKMLGEFAARASSC